MSDQNLHSIISGDDIREMVYAFRRSRIILTAFELEIFTVIGDDAKSSSEIAKLIKTDVRATDRLLHALSALGILQKKDNLFINTPATATYLVKGKPNYMAGMMHSVNLWDSWTTLTESVKKGTSVRKRDDRENGRKEAFIAAMHDRGAKQALVVAQMLDLTGVKRVLDVGGGSGAFSMAFVKANKNCIATIFDLPDIIPITEKYIFENQFSEKIKTKAGNYLYDDFGSGYDLVFLSAIIHINSFEQNRNLIRRCAESLNPNGQVVVLDFIMDENRVQPPVGALFALNMLVATEAGDTYTEADVRSWMEDAGLRNIIRQDTPFASSQIIGRK